MNVDDREANLNAVELEVIRNALVAAAEEMSVTVWRTSRSSVVREILDYSTCVFDADGKSVAQAARMPVHLNSMASCLNDLLRDHIPLDEWQDGDIILTNDPYCGGQPLSDWLAFTPSPPLVFGNVGFVDGANVMMEFTDVSAGQLAVGTPVELRFRIKDFDDRRRFRRYFWKPTPSEAA